MFSDILIFLFLLFKGKKDQEAKASDPFRLLNYGIVSCKSSGWEPGCAISLPPAPAIKLRLVSQIIGEGPFWNALAIREKEVSISVIA